MQRNIFWILMNQIEIRLYILFSDWFGTKRTSVCFQINLKMVNTIWFRFYLIGFRKPFSQCRTDVVMTAICSRGHLTNARRTYERGIFVRARGSRVSRRHNFDRIKGNPLNSSIQYCDDEKEGVFYSRRGGGLLNGLPWCREAVISRPVERTIFELTNCWGYFDEDSSWYPRQNTLSNLSIY